MAKKQIEAPAAKAETAGKWSMEITSPPVAFSGTPIARLEIAPHPFSEYVACVKEARADMARDGGSALAKYLFRAQVRRQLVATDAAGNRVAVSDMDIMTMHPKIAMAIQRGVSSVPSGNAGEALASGDGVSAPILYRLGTPINLGTSKSTGEALIINEIEFQAVSYGVIEDVMFADWAGEQAELLIRLCARPVNAPGGLISLPDQAVAQITEGDGFKIMADVLPRFFEQPSL